MRTRREFLEAGAGLWLLGPTVLRAAPSPPPSERVTVGCIGVGGRGRLNMRGLMHYGAQVVAVCDVDQRNRATALRQVEAFYAARKGQTTYRGCLACSDFREVLAREDVDAVMVATPDHWHVPIAVAAARRGKNLYVEKPLGVSVAEGQALREAVRRHGVVFMHGTEQRCMAQFRLACELVRNGYLGRLKIIKVACPGGRVGPVCRPEPVPRGLDYEMWLGPAPWKPYSAARVRPGNWYFISDYAASGFVAGWGIHHMDIVQWALDADNSGPLEIETQAVFPSDGIFNTPVTWEVNYHYAGGIRVNFTDNRKNRQGIRLEGTEGWVHVTRSSITAEPRSLLTKRLGPNDIRLYRCESDDKNFLECVRTRRPTASPIEAAHRSTSVCYIAHISMVLGRPLRWNPVAERFVGDEEANRLLARPHREPWGL